jgi:hypothetical protein
VLLYARSTLDPHHQFDLVVGRWDADLFQWKVATNLGHAGELTLSASPYASINPPQLLIAESLRRLSQLFATSGGHL